MSRPRPRLENFLLCYEILFMLRPRLIETRKFCGCRDRNSSRLGNSLVVETETHRDWEILWLSRPRLIETGSFCGCRDRDQPKLNKSCRDRDFIESLTDLCIESFSALSTSTRSFTHLSTCMGVPIHSPSLFIRTLLYVNVTTL